MEKAQRLGLSFLVGLILLITQTSAAKKTSEGEEKEGFMDSKFMRGATYYSKKIIQDGAVRIGLNIGASAPFGISDNISPLSYSPNFSPVIAFDREFLLWKGLFFSTGIRLEYKGMHTKAKVHDFQTNVEIENEDGSITKNKGKFTGVNSTNVNCAYATLPLDIGWRFNKHYRLRLGAYISYRITGSFTGSASDGYMWSDPEEGSTLSNKLLIEDAQDFDFSKELRSWDWGVEIAGMHRITDHFFMEAAFAVGVPKIFVDDFKGVSMEMHHLYGSVSVGYHFLPSFENEGKKKDALPIPPATPNGEKKM
ncbi:MAG: hypothetical protein CSA97_01370 [Bacteroidetes bacterium]|nr:MAG: hypothetical protein CSA97_01370 [Bacteroidota bacterium]